MKGLDTPVLLTILHDSPGARALARDLRGEEIATTELNIFELELIAGGVTKARGGQLRSTIDKLRRRLTVLPIDGSAVQAASALSARGVEGSPLQLLMWGAVEHAGCSEWITTRPNAPKSRWKVKVRFTRP